LIARVLWVALLAAFLVSCVPSRNPSRAETQPAPLVVRDPRFGLNQAWEAADAADQAGAGWSRLVFWWRSMQPNGPRDFNLFATDQDSYINDERRRGRELSGLLINVPAWASSNGGPNGVPLNLYLPADHPDNYWGQFTRRMAEHYRGRIDSWIIWNEIDIPSGQWHTWDGDEEDYLQLLKVAYINIKAANPDAKVVLFGSPWWYDRGAYLSRLLDRIAADPESRAHGDYFDVVNLHMYSRANDILRVVPWYREQLAARGMVGKQVWVGETNAIPYDDQAWKQAKSGYRASMDEQASYIVQAFATYLALDVERVGVNRLVDGADFTAGGEPFGLLRNDGSERPSYRAFQVVSRYFSGTKQASYAPPDASGVHAVVLLKEDERITVAWNMRPQSLRISLDAVVPEALLVSKYGETQVIEAEDGVYRLELEGATANSNEADPNDFVVGGSPVILVERLDGNPEASIRPIAPAGRIR
jgi:hypothetical protein